MGGGVTHARCSRCKWRRRFAGCRTGGTSPASALRPAWARGGARFPTWGDKLGPQIWVTGPRYQSQWTCLCATFPLEACVHSVRLGFNARRRTNPDGPVLAPNCLHQYGGLLRRAQSLVLSCHLPSTPLSQCVCSAILFHKPVAMSSYLSFLVLLCAWIGVSAVTKTSTPQATPTGTPTSSGVFLSNVIYDMAGTGTFGYNGDGIDASSALLSNPLGVAVLGNGDIYFADSDNNRVRLISSSSGIITTVAGNGSFGYSGDSILATKSQLNNPTGVAILPNGNLYIADRLNHRVRLVVFATGIISTIAGTGITNYNGDGSQFDGILATTAKLNQPYGLAVHENGNLFIADYGNHCVRFVNASTRSTRRAGRTARQGSLALHFSNCMRTHTRAHPPVKLSRRIVERSPHTRYSPSNPLPTPQNKNQKFQSGAL